MLFQYNWFTTHYRWYYMGSDLQQRCLPIFGEWYYSIILHAK